MAEYTASATSKLRKPPPPTKVADDLSSQQNQIPNPWKRCSNVMKFTEAENTYYGSDDAPEPLFEELAMCAPSNDFAHDTNVVKERSVCPA